MKASVYYNKDEICYEDMNIPEIGDGDVLIKMKSCGLCGTDIHKAKNQTVTGPVVLGHEVAGEVVKVGKSVLRFKEGDRVVTAIHVPCFTCHYCDRGHYTMCEQFRKTNIEPGGFSEYIRLPALHANHLTHKLTPETSWEHAAMVEPVACCLHGLKAANVHARDAVVVLGAGTIGLVSAQLAAMKGALNIMVTDVSKFKLEQAKKLGVTHTINSLEENVEEKVKEYTNGFGPDIVVIAAGVPSLFAQAVNMVRRGGKVIVFTPFDKDNMVTIDAGRFFKDEITVIGTYSLTPYEMVEATQIICQGRINVKDMITHTFPLSELKEAINFAANPKNEVLKVIMMGETDK